MLKTINTVLIWCNNEVRPRLIQNDLLLINTNTRLFQAVEVKISVGLFSRPSFLRKKIN